MGSTTHHRARVYAVHPQNPQPRELDQLVEILRTDGVIIYPTDTLYGLGCSIESPKAIARIARIKGLKPREARFSFICERLGQVAEYARMSDATYSVLRHSLPGPFTMILPGLSKCGESFMSPRKTVGIRIPNHAIPLALVRLLGCPILTSSLPLDAEEPEYGQFPELMAERWGTLVDAVIDGGQGELTPSTVVDCTQSEIRGIRQGKGELARE